MPRPMKILRLKKNKQIISSEKISQVQDADNCINEKLNYIKMLNNDCMLLIFRFLSTEERFRIKRVNKYWSNLIDESWYMNKSLDFTPILEKIYKSNDLDNVVLVIEKIFTVCGSYLNKVRMLDMHDYISPHSRSIIKFKHSYELMTLIGKFCPNVNVLELNGVDIAKGSYFTEIINNCSKITELELCFYDAACEDVLSVLFLKNKNLKSLKLSSNIVGRCLDNLSNQLEVVSLNGTDNIRYKYLINLLDRTNLQTFSLWNQHSNILNNSSLNNKIGSCLSLKKLELVNVHNLCCENMNFIFRLHKLEELKIDPPTFNLNNDSNYIDDEFLQMLSKNCTELKKLEISEANLMTDQGLMFLTSLKNLNSLTVFFCEKITDAPFVHFLNLKYLDCTGCYSIKNKGLRLLVESNPNLSYLSVWGCKSMNKDFVKSVVRITSKRTNNVVLKLCTRGTKMYLDEEKNYSNYLKLVQEKGRI